MKIPDARLHFKGRFFTHGDLLAELQSIRQHHTSPTNQLLHILSFTLALGFFLAALNLVSAAFIGVNVPCVFLSLALCISLIKYWWFLDELVALTWVLPLAVSFIMSIVLLIQAATYMWWLSIGSLILAGFVSLLPQLVGHLLFEPTKLPAFEPFEASILTPFFMGYCMLAVVTCGRARQDVRRQIWCDSSLWDCGTIEKSPSVAIVVDKKDPDVVMKLSQFIN